jgi:hypothetical protein
LACGRTRQLRTFAAKRSFERVCCSLTVTSASQTRQLNASASGFDLISWSFERVDLRRGAAGVEAYYDFDPTGAAIKKDSDMYKALDVLAKDVKLIGLFSDWPATVGYLASI